MPFDQVDEAFRRARAGDKDAFAAWMGMVEIPLRRSLAKFARVIDVEVAVQETLMRMWVLAADSGREIEGTRASLKFAFRVARNVALEEMRRYRQGRFINLEALDGLPEGSVAPETSDPALVRIIKTCMERLPKQPRHALSARLQSGMRPDRELAAQLRMKTNTFLQNIVRARRLLRTCLERGGVRLAEILS